MLGRASARQDFADFGESHGLGVGAGSDMMSGMEINCTATRLPSSRISVCQRIGNDLNLKSLLPWYLASASRHSGGQLSIGRAPSVSASTARAIGFALIVARLRAWRKGSRYARYRALPPRTREPTIDGRRKHHRFDDRRTVRCDNDLANQVPSTAFTGSYIG